MIASGQEYAAGVRRKALSIAHSLAYSLSSKQTPADKDTLRGPGHAAGGLAGAHLRHPAGSPFPGRSGQLPRRWYSGCMYDEMMYLTTLLEAWLAPICAILREPISGQIRAASLHQPPG